MKLKTQANTQAAVPYHACTHNTVPAQYTDLALTASTVSEKCSIRQILQDLSDFLMLRICHNLFIPTLTLQLFLSQCHCLMLYSDSCCNAKCHFELVTTC